MFSRNKDKAKEAERPVIQVPAPSLAPQQPVASSKRPATRATPSIISSDLVVHGNLLSTGDIQIDGTVEGDVRSQSLTIGEKASISGELIAEDIVIRGRVIGTIRGRRVQLASTSHVEGDILHEALAVETGAFFEGNCRHSDDPINHQTQPRTATLSAAVARPAGPAIQPRPVMPQAPVAAAPRPVAPAPANAPAVKDPALVTPRPAAQ